MKDKSSINKLLKKLSLNKKLKLIFAGVLFLVVLIIFSSTFFLSEKEEKLEYQNTILEANSFVTNTENRLKNVLGFMKEIETIEVFVYVKSSEEIVYLKDQETTTNQTSNNTTVKETVVFSKDGSSSKAIVVVTKYPKIEGVLIVAGGSFDAKLKLKIIDAVSCILSIAPTNIEVLEGKS